MEYNSCFTPVGILISYAKGTYILLSQPTTLFLNVFRPAVHRLRNCISIKCFWMGTKPFWHSLSSLTDPHFIYSYINSAFRLSRIRCSICSLISTHHLSTESLCPFVNFPSVIATLNCHYTVNFSTVDTLSPQKSDHRSLCFHGAVCRRSSQGECLTILYLF
jgi:hypothetical protein